MYNSLLCTLVIFGLLGIPSHKVPDYELLEKWPSGLDPRRHTYHGGNTANTNSKSHQQFPPPVDMPHLRAVSRKETLQHFISKRLKLICYFTTSNSDACFSAEGLAA